MIYHITTVRQVILRKFIDVMKVCPDRFLNIFRDIKKLHFGDIIGLWKHIVGKKAYWLSLSKVKYLRRQKKNAGNCVSGDIF